MQRSITYGIANFSHMPLARPTVYYFAVDTIMLQFDIMKVNLANKFSKFQQSVQRRF